MIPLKKERPKVGKLVQLLRNGKRITLVDSKPFPVLQKAKAEYIRRGYRRETLLITYLDADKKRLDASRHAKIEGYRPYKDCAYKD